MIVKQRIIILYFCVYAVCLCVYMCVCTDLSVFFTIISKIRSSNMHLCVYVCTCVHAFSCIYMHVYICIYKCWREAMNVYV